MGDESHSNRCNHPETKTAEYRIAGLYLHRIVFEPVLVETLKALQRLGMNHVVQCQAALLPDDESVLFCLSDLAIVDAMTKIEIDSILANLLNFDDPEPVHFSVRGEFAEYEILDFVRL